MLIGELTKHPPHNSNFLRRPGNQSHSFTSNAFTLAITQQSFGLTPSVEQHSAHSINGLTARFETVFREADKASSNLDGKFSTVFAGHCPFQSFHDE
jgi:hypothetical protein